MPTRCSIHGRGPDGLVHAGEDVAQVAAAEILHVGQRELLALAVAAARVGQQHEIALLREQRRIEARARPGGLHRLTPGRRARPPPADTSAPDRNRRGRSASPARGSRRWSSAGSWLRPTAAASERFASVRGFHAPMASGPDLGRLRPRTANQRREVSPSSRHRDAGPLEGRHDASRRPSRGARLARWPGPAARWRCRHRECSVK